MTFSSSGSSTIFSKYNNNNPNNESYIKRTLAVIPCFNEESAIGSVVLKTRQYVDEVLVIDDGSSDQTKKIAREAGATVLSHNTNLGKATGIKTGFQYALDMILNM